MSQKDNSEWRNIRIGCKHVVHKVYLHPVTWDALYNRLEEKVPLFDLQPLSIHRSVDGKKFSSSIWCPSFSTILSKNPQGIKYLDLR
jgi:hypothetical protein